MSSTSEQPPHSPRIAVTRKWRGLAWKGGIAAAALVAVFAIWGRPGETGSTATTFPVAHGSLEITVVEGGNVESREAQEIRSQVQGQTQILTIVEEGYRVTQEDIDNGKILVELDSSQLVEQLTQQEITYLNASAALTEAREQFQIQVSQNESDIHDSELALKFARMDLERYVGEHVGRSLLVRLDELDEQERLAGGRSSSQPEASPTSGGAAEERHDGRAPASEASAAQAEGPRVVLAQQGERRQGRGGSGPGGDGGPHGGGMEGLRQLFEQGDGSIQERLEDPAFREQFEQMVPDEEQRRRLIERFGGGERRERRVEEEPPQEFAEPELFDIDVEMRSVELDLDYLELLADEQLGGEAQQRLRNLAADITLAAEELTQARTRYEWTRELAGEGFVTSAEEESDRLSVQRREIQLQSAQTSDDLFRAFEFPKQLESYISDYNQQKRRLERTQRLAAARLAQAEAKLRSNEATYQLQARRKQELQEQIDNCIIRAERPGIVVYAGSNQRGGEIIEEGATVRERQEILTIPDMTKMAVNVQIHESMVNRLMPGLPARIRADAFPDEVLRGEVVRVALVPDSGHRWLNPDLRVFPTAVSIDGAFDWLRPGMTAEVEVIVDRLDDILYVPVQCVINLGGQRYVYVATTRGVEARPVEIGPYNDRFIQIREGVEEGEQVLLRPPRPTGAQDDDRRRSEDSDEAPSGEERLDGPASGMPGTAT